MEHGDDTPNRAPPREGPARGDDEPLDAARVYREHFALVWRSLAQLGVPAQQLDDAAQNVFVVVARKLHTFEGRASVRTWLFRIALRVASDVRRAQRRHRPTEALGVEELDPPDPSPGPEAQYQSRQARELLLRILDELDDDRRTIFVLSELQQLSMPEISELLELNPNTAASRLRAARSDFEAALRRHRSAR